MNISELNSKFGAPGRIVFREGFSGSPDVVLANKYGTAEVALMGANVLSYRPTGHSPVIFRPAKRDYAPGDSFHGGIPVCWPQFGSRANKNLPQHGFARSTEFKVLSTEYSEDKTEITLGISSNNETYKLWPYDFKFEVKIILSMKLTLSMVTKNIGNEAFEFNCGFHPYFAIRDIDLVTVKGIDGCEYVDGHDPKLEKHMQTGDFKANHAPDHIFSLEPAPKHEVAVMDSGIGRAIAMVSSGNTKLVVWNVGKDTSLPDFEPGDWRRYVCVEPVSEWPGPRPLKPGESHEMLVAIQSTLEPKV